jgi:excisionase family DNA binding protein
MQSRTMKHLRSNLLDRADLAIAPVGARLLTVKQASEQAQISVRQLRRMIRTGELKVKRFGKAVCIHPEHLGL